MKTRIIFSTNKKIGSVVIRFGTWSDYSHCDVIGPTGHAGKIIGATPGGGVISYSLADRIGMSTKWMIYEVDADPHQVWAYLETQLGKPYDWLGCLGIAFHRDWEDDDKWFCSELIAKAFLEAGAPLLNPEIKINRITPEDLLSSPELKRIEV